MPTLAIPHLFSPGVVRRVVTPGRAGAYALGYDNGGFVVGYVGRSDHSVCDRLATHERLGEFDYFIVRYARGPVAAFALECEYWHACRQSGLALANVIHPAAPRGSGAACPYCHFATHVQGLLTAA